MTADNPFAAPTAAPSLDAVPPPPRTPSPRAMALVYGFGGARGVLIIIGLGFLLLGAPFPLIFCWDLPADLAIAASHREVPGVVTGHEEQTHIEVGDRHPTRVRYTYVVDGRTYDGATDTTDPRVLGPAITERRVPLEVSTLRPTWVRIAGTTRNTFGYFPAFTLLFPLLGLVMFLRGARRNKRVMRAFRFGTPAVGRVVSRGEDTSVEINERHPYKIAWEFEAHDGRTYRGALSTTQLDQLADLAHAERVTVLYDSRDPSSNTLYVA